MILPMHLTTIGSIACGATAAFLAHRRGKNIYLWFILGAFFGIFGIALLFFTSPRKGAHPRRQKADPNTIDITPKIDPIHKEKFWYYLDPENQQQGPMSFDGLFRAFREGRVSKNTFVWNENLDNWQPLGDFI